MSPQPFLKQYSRFIGSKSSAFPVLDAPATWPPATTADPFGSVANPGDDRAAAIAAIATHSAGIGGGPGGGAGAGPGGAGGTGADQFRATQPFVFGFEPDEVPPVPLTVPPTYPEPPPPSSTLIAPSPPAALRPEPPYQPPPLQT